MKTKHKKQTDSELATLANVNPSTICRWKKRRDFPKPGKDGRITEAVVLEYAAKRHEAMIRQQTGPNGDLKREKLQNQVNLLREQARRAKTEADYAVLRLQRENNEVLTWDRHLDDMASLMMVNLGLWEQARQTIAGKRKDASILKELDDAMNHARQQLVDSLHADEAKAFHEKEKQHAK